MVQRLVNITANSLIAATNQRNATERNGFAELIDLNNQLSNTDNYLGLNYSDYLLNLTDNNDIQKSLQKLRFQGVPISIKANRIAWSGRHF